MPERVNVYIRSERGEYAASIEAKSSKDAMQQAVEFFMLDWWKGPKPEVGMTFRIVGVYRRFELRMRVTEEMMKAARAKRSHRQRD